jgi:processive 1,2-diacylglycerol beta-glucosyltransferase
MIRVFGWQTSPAAEHDFRIGLPFPLLDPNRFETTIGQPGKDIGTYDVVFAHRLAGRSDLWLKLCANPNVLTVYDMDDDLLCVDPANAVPYSIFHPLEAGTRANVMAADIVTVSSPGLLERYSEMRRDVTTLPVCIPDGMPDWPIPQRDGLTIGWAGSMHKRQDWPGIAQRLARLAALLPTARFRVYGGDYTGGQLAGRLDVVPFTTDVDAYWRSLEFDIGIAPLADTPFNAGKTHTKLIEYGARGIPTVASAIGEYAQWIDHGVNGFLVRDPAEWIPYLLALADPQTRAEVGAAAHATARQWTISRHIHRWEQVFTGVST